MSISEAHVFWVGGVRVELSLARRREVEQLLGRANPRRVSETYEIPLALVMHIWAAWREAHHVPTLLV